MIFKITNAIKQEENNPVLEVSHPLIFITFDETDTDGGQKINLMLYFSTFGYKEQKHTEVISSNGLTDFKNRHTNVHIIYVYLGKRKVEI